jgi:diguanylate cyclase
MSAASNSPDPPTRLQQSAEHLRLSLPLLSKHGSDFGPQSYALWFTYSEGTHPRLTAALDRFVQDGTRLSMSQTAELYSTLLAGADEDAIARMRDSFIQLLTRTATSTAAASASAADFGDAVERESAVLSSATVDAAGLARLVEQSHLFAHSLTVLSGQLNESHEEVNRLREELHAVRREAATDGLTRLHNRRSFDDAIDALCVQAEAHGRPFSLIMVDVDHFKSINDLKGHVFGDRVLRAIADTLKAHVKGRDTVSRYGGEEFAVLLPDTALAAAMIVAEQLRAAVSAVRIRHSGTDKEVAKVSVSCGVACRRAADLPPSLIERADRALYQAKGQGRNRVVAQSGGE